MTIVANRGELDCKDVFDFAAHGDELAQGIVEDVATKIGVLIINICRVIDPEMVILTGGMALNAESFFGPVKRAYLDHHWSIVPPTLQIVPSAFDARFDAFAGSIGAACAARNRVLAGLEQAIKTPRPA